MLEIISFLCLLAGLTVLYYLSKIDLEEGLLPNELVAGFLALGLVFNLTTVFVYTTIPHMALGGVIGGGILFVIRMAANAYYKDDALGLGDVKLLGAAGVWLGPEHILFALIAGATAGLFHGLGVAAYKRIKMNEKVDMNTLSIPAGPGFAAGIVIVAAYKFHTIQLPF